MKNLLISIMTLSFLLAGCAPPEDQSIDGPEVTMDVPPTLSGVVDNQAAAKVLARATASDCSQYLTEDITNNWMKNGYYTTKFLVGLSQTQTCWADLMTTALLSHARPMVNNGLQELDVDPSNNDPATHMKVVESGGVYQVWLFWANAGDANSIFLPGVKTLYITWDQTNSGSFMMANADNGSEGTSSLRVDFTRGTGNIATNDIFFQFANNPSNIEAFRATVTKTTDAVTGAASYKAKSLMTLNGQPMQSILPSVTGGAYTSTPAFAAIAIADANGQGAAVAAIQDFAIPVADAASGMNLGPYEFSVDDKSYFSSTGVIEWRNKTIPASGAIYVGSGGRGGNQATTDAITAIETAMSNSGYFTSPCSATDGANCEAFIQFMYDNDWMNSGDLNSTDPEPADSRNSDITTEIGLGYMSAVYLAGDSDGSQTFAIPGF